LYKAGSEVGYQEDYDLERQSEIKSLGIIFLKFTNNEVYHDLETMLQKIETRIRELSNIKS